MYNRTMPKYIEVEPYLAVEELESRYRGADDGIGRSHWQIIWLIANGKQSSEVSEVTGYSGQWIRQLVKRYNAHGPSALGDQRQHNPGGNRLLSAEQEAALRAEVEADIAANQRWTGPQVAARMREILQRPVHAVRGWELLQRWGLTQKVPRPQPVKANLQAQAAFKKI